MNRPQLIRMANQIGEFFASQPDHDEAVANLAQHLQRFWERRMREEFQQLLDEGGEGAQALLPIVREACARHGLETG